MHLSRFLLNAASRDVQRCLADSQALHARVMDLFAPKGNEIGRLALGVLHRLEVMEGEGIAQLLVQSGTPPDPSRWPQAFLDPRVGADASATTPLAPLLEQICEGAVFRFRLRANPTRRIDTKSSPDGTRRHGKRVPVRGAPARAAWLARKLSASGLALKGEIRERPEGTVQGRRHARTITHEAFVFEGVAQVTDASHARRAVIGGIGPAKAYGFGLLSLAPLPADM
jgi:CRISPR system Cascade subunit CasE